MGERRELRTSLGKAELDRVLVRGHDLTEELVGRITFSDMVALELLGRLPSEEQRRMLDALLVVLVEHGLVKPVVQARFVYSNAPESLQAAVAASLLGAGSRHLGSSEWCAQVLQEGLPDAAADGGGTGGTGGTGGVDGIEEVAARIVEEYAARRERIPGIGHRTHAEGDPRALRLFEIARETGVYGRYCTLLERIAERAGQRRGRPLPVNVTGAIAAIASDMGFRWQITRAFALIGRTLGALAHIQEEMDDPISEPLIERIREDVSYRASPSAP
jgi:citrate synthase